MNRRERRRRTKLGDIVEIKFGRVVFDIKPGEDTRACTHKIAIGDSNLINVRFGPLCGLKEDVSRGPRSANCGLMRRSKTSAVARLFDHLVGAGKSVGGTSRQSAFAVLRLITSSYLVGFCTGRSAGFSPLRMRSA
jgi:hypothetical protein